MLDAFATAVEFVLKQEGGLTNDPADPGGLTNFGIDQRSHPGVDVRALTRDGAIAIYRETYWAGSKADQLPTALAILFFDAAVNQGARAATTDLQRSLRVAEDGALGPVTLQAVATVRDQRVLAVEFAARRAMRYGSTSTFPRFGLGWMRRLMACLNLSLSQTES
jgi:lysozyme family protein